MKKTLSTLKTFVQCWIINMNTILESNHFIICLMNITYLKPNYNLYSRQNVNEKKMNKIGYLFQRQNKTILYYLYPNLSYFKTLTMLINLLFSPLISSPPLSVWTAQPWGSEEKSNRPWWKIFLLRIGTNNIGTCKGTLNCCFLTYF